jgi:NAD(P)-dependent dehydrogenase (short-subunit alcohol dehydrogenase family)
MKQFENKVAVITGAGSGFGREFARIGHKLGMRLVLADIQSDALQATIVELEGLGAQVIGEQIDVSKAVQVEGLAQAAVKKFGSIDLAFNNAGVGSGGLIWENSLRDWEWVMGVNVMGVVHGIHYFTPIMLAQGSEGHIVNTASMAGLLSAQLMGVYNVSKHAVVTLSETLYQDLRITNAKIGTSVLCPAFVPTGIHQSHRNRPDELSNQNGPTASQLAAQKNSEKAVTSGKITAEQVALQVFDAIRDNQFYIFTHQKIMGSVETRMQDMLQGRNPSDPFAQKTDVGQAIKSSML